MDKVSKEKRSEIMSKIRGKDTGPEIKLRKALHAAVLVGLTQLLVLVGFRYRTHVKTVPGKADIVLAKHKALIYVNGCFWHAHDGCFKMPASNVDFWKAKISRNVERDKENKSAAENMGWRVFTVWECEIKKNLPGTVENIRRLLSQRY
jgi:DNA mismatch endonuclease, patch repair protein